MTFEIETNVPAGAHRVALIDFVMHDNRSDPGTTHRFAIVLSPDGRWVAEGNMIFDEGAATFIEACVEEANKRGVRFVMDQPS